MNEWLGLIESAVKECKETERKAREERELWEHLRKMLPEAEQRPFALLNLTEKLRNLNERCTDQLYNLEQHFVAIGQEQISRYRNLLEQALAQDGYTVEGSFREGYRVNKVVEIIIDEPRRRARIGTRFHSISVDDISCATVAEAVRQEMQRLFSRPLESDFINTLFKAYTIALADEGKPCEIGQLVSILNLHRFVVFLRQKESIFRTSAKDRFEPYLPDEFAVDIGRLLEQGATTTENGYSLHLTPGRNPKESLFIVNFASRTGQNYSFVSFRRT